MTLAVSLLSFTVVIATASPAAASPPSVGGTSRGALSYLPAASRAPAQTLLSSGDATRAAIAAGSYARAVTAILEANGTAPAVTPALPAPTAQDLARVATLPHALGQPVAGLWATVRTASALLGGISIGELRQELNAVSDVMASYPERALLAYRAASPASTSLLTASSGAVQAQPPGSSGPVRTDMFSPLPLQPATIHAMQDDPAASLLLGAALDRYVPELLAARSQVDASASSAASACDLLDETPYICVGSASNHTYTKDEALLIAMGGSNTYTNGAGAAPFLPAGGTQAMPVALNVDLGGGTDTYTAPASSLTADATGASYPHLMMGQGAAIFGGLGMSINLAGDDAYTAKGQLPSAPTASTPAPEAFTIAQGATLDGAAFLFDGGGNDRYIATSPVLSQTGRPFVLAQGAAITGSAALVQRGGGNTTYTVSGGGYRSATPSYTFTTLMAQSVAVNEASAVLYDDGGSDVFNVGTGSSTTGIISQPLQGNPNFQVDAQGYSDIGSAMLLEGSGAHRYHIGVNIQNSGSATWGVEGQGTTDFAGTSLLQDKGGPNSYDLEATMAHTETTTIGPTCTCTSATYKVDGGAGDAPGSLDAGSFAPVNVRGQGAVSVGVAVLDNAGAATYRAVSTATMNVTLHDDLLAPTAPAALGVHGFLSPDLMAQGSAEFGYPNESQTEALLINHAGHASYTLVTSDAVRAIATSAHGPRPQVSAQSSFQWARTPGSIGGQGSNVWNADVYNGSLGALLDLGGPGDTLRAQQIDTATTSPDSGLDIAPGGFWSPFQGAGEGGLLLVAGASPSISANPAVGICPQSPSPRGFGTWVACDNYTTSMDTNPDRQAWDFLGGSFDPGHAAGYAPSSTGVLPELALTAPASAKDDGAVKVAATLSGSGTPLAHAPVHFTLQGALPVGPSGATNAELQWLTLGQVDATTNIGGIAAARLPIFLLAVAGGEPSTLRLTSYRVVATFDGGAGLYPHHVASAISISDGP